MAERYTNIRLIIDKIMRNPLMSDLSFETAVDYTIDFMRIVGVPSMFEDKVTTLEVKDYRALLPCDYYETIQIKNSKDNIAFRYTTDSFMLSPNNKEGNIYTYKIQGGIIYTSLKEATIELSYRAIAVDDEGYPLIPDNSSFTRALELYIKKQWYTILFDLGKINPNAFNQTLQDYAWAVGDCQTEFNRLSLDKAESFFNSYRTLLMRTNMHSEGFKNNGNKEYIKIH